MAIVMLIIQVNEDGAHRMLDTIGDRLERPTQMLQRMADDLRDYEAEVFSTRGHGTWGDADLVDTGALLGKLTGPANLDMGSDAVEVQGTEYAGYLRAGARGMPKRDPAPVPPTDVQERWADDVLDSLLGGLL